MSSASAGRDQARRASNQDNSLKTQQDDGTKLSHGINLLFTSQLTRTVVVLDCLGTR